MVVEGGDGSWSRPTAAPSGYRTETTGQADHGRAPCYGCRRAQSVWTPIITVIGGAAKGPMACGQQEVPQPRRAKAESQHVLASSTDLCYAINTWHRPPAARSGEREGHRAAVRSAARAVSNRWWLRESKHTTRHPSCQGEAYALIRGG